MFNNFFNYKKFILLLKAEVKINFIQEQNNVFQMKLIDADSLIKYYYYVIYS